jgi:hypothetical protein
MIFHKSLTIRTGAESLEEGSKGREGFGTGTSQSCLDRGETGDEIRQKAITKAAPDLSRSIMISHYSLL